MGPVCKQGAQEGLVAYRGCIGQDIRVYMVLFGSHWGGGTGSVGWCLVSLCCKSAKSAKSPLLSTVKPFLLLNCFKCTVPSVRGRCADLIGLQGILCGFLLLLTNVKCSYTYKDRER